MCDIKLTSTPGYCPLSKYGTTIREVLGHDGLRFDAQRVSLFKLLVKDRVRELVSGKCEADDIKVFVKEEPHKLSKIKDGAFRLISAVSMVDTMIDRMIFGPLADKILQSAGLTPVMIGWVPIMGGFRLPRRKLPGKVVCVDKSSWDWTVPQWMVKLWMKIILGLSNEHPPFWEVLVRQRFKILFEEAIFRFSDGTRIKQGEPGVMKSGCYLTIILNSLGQLLLHYMINDKMGIPMEENEPLCMGDDTVQNYFPQLEEYVNHFSLLGFRLKEVSVQDWIEFAGFGIDKVSTWPMYWRKHLFAMQHASEESLPQMLESYQMLYAFNAPMTGYIQGVMKKVNPDKILPGSLLRSFVSGGSIYARAWHENREGCIQSDHRF